MHSTKFGGLEKYFLEMAEILNKRGDSLYLVYNSKPNSEEYISELKKNNAEIIVADLNGTNTIKIAINLIKIIKKVKPDFVHLHFGKVARNCFYIPQLMGYKTYRTLHSLLVFNPKTKFLSALRYKPMHLFYNKVLTVSSAIKKELLKVSYFKEEQVLVRYIGTNIENNITRNVSTNKEINICCIAFHNHIKGIDILIDALYLLKTKYNYNNFKLTEIGGDNDEYKKLLEEQVKRLNLENEITFYGLSNNIPQLLAQMDIYVQPSRNEGIGLALMEAATQELPLVGSEIGGIPEVIDDGVNGFLFPVEDSEKLAEKLHYLCTNSQEREKMGKWSRKIVEERFNLKTNTRQLVEEIY